MRSVEVLITESHRLATHRRINVRWNRNRFAHGAVQAVGVGLAQSDEERNNRRSKALGHSAEREVVGVKKRVLSAAGRAAIAKAAKKRWAKVRK